MAFSYTARVRAWRNYCVRFRVELYACAGVAALLLCGVLVARHLCAADGAVREFVVVAAEVCRAELLCFLEVARVEELVECVFVWRVVTAFFVAPLAVVFCSVDAYAVFYARRAGDVEPCARAYAAVVRLARIFCFVIVAGHAWLARVALVDACNAFVPETVRFFVVLVFAVLFVAEDAEEPVRCFADACVAVNALGCWRVRVVVDNALCVRECLVLFAVE